LSQSVTFIQLLNSVMLNEQLISLGENYEN